MALYGISLLPLTNTLRNVPDTKQMTYADDITGAGKLEALRAWWEYLLHLGPKIGYFPEPSKSWLIVKPAMYQEALKEFDDTHQ